MRGNASVPLELGGPFMLGPTSSARSEATPVLEMSCRSLSFDSTASSRLEDLICTTHALILPAPPSLQYPRRQRQLKWTQLSLSQTVYLQSIKLPRVERYLIKLQEDEKLFARVSMTETNLLMETLQGKWCTVRNLKAQHFIFCLLA